MRGSLRERAPGVWELRVFIGRDPVTGRPRQVSRTFKGRERAAETALAKLVTEAAAGKFGGAHSTVATLLDAWLKDVKRQVSPATFAVYRQSVEQHLRDGLGRTRLDKLTVKHLDDLYRVMGERGASPYIIKQAHSAIRAALTLGMRWGWVPTNVAMLAKPPPLPRKDVVAPTPDELHRLARQLEADDPDMALAVLLVACTGIRRAELCALRWSHWDGERLTAGAKRLVEARGHVTEETGAKAGKAKRLVLDEYAIMVLDRLRALQLARAAEAGVKLPKDGYLLSYDGLGGTPRRPKNVSRSVGDAARAAGMPEIHLHSLRHYSATELIAAGMDPRTVANRLGHSSPTITLDVYSHRIEERDREAAAILGRTIAGALTRPKETP